MYNTKNYVQTNQYGFEFQIGENYEVLSKGTNVQLLSNGYILSGHTRGEEIIKEKVNIGDFLIYIKEVNTIYIFEKKKRIQICLLYISN